MSSFGIKRTLDRGFDEVLAKVPEALKTEGFGVLTEIDVQATLKKKLDVDFRPLPHPRRLQPALRAPGALAPLEIGCCCRAT